MLSAKKQEPIKKKVTLPFHHRSDWSCNTSDFLRFLYVTITRLLVF